MQRIREIVYSLRLEIFTISTFILAIFFVILSGELVTAKNHYELGGDPYWFLILLSQASRGAFSILLVITIVKNIYLIRIYIEDRKLPDHIKERPEKTSVFLDPKYQ